jgi:hypothetical protein
VDSIVRETGWRKDQAEEHGDAILKVIYTHIPLPVPPPINPVVPPTVSANDASHAAQVSSDTGPTTRKQRRPYTCSKCHQEGHISAYYIFLLAEHTCLSVKGSNRSCPARIASRTVTYNSGTHTAVANENIVPHGTIEDSTGNPLPPKRSYYRNTPYTRPEPTTQVLNDAPGPSTILVSTSRSNHYVPNPPAPPIIHQPLNPGGTP